MFKRLYYSTALALIPSAEAAIKRIEKAVGHLDTITVHLEGQLEEKAVQLAKNSRAQRSLSDFVHSTYLTVINAVHDAFYRRERAVITEIGDLRSKLEKASSARDAVAAVLKL